MVSQREVDHNLREPRSTEGRLVVIGDRDFADNQHLELLANRDLVLNAIGWLLDDERHITIRPRTHTASQLTLTGGQMRTLRFAAMAVMPASILAIGFGIVVVRRRR